MICVRCGHDKAENDMGGKQSGHRRNWCKDCEAARKRAARTMRIAAMHNRVLQVSAAVGRQLAEDPL